MPFSKGFVPEGAPRLIASEMVDGQLWTLFEHIQGATAEEVGTPGHSRPRRVNSHGFRRRREAGSHAFTGVRRAQSAGVLLEDDRRTSLWIGSMAT